METTSSLPEDKYYPQDDMSEAIRQAALAGQDTEAGWDADTYGNFTEDGT